MNYLFLHISIIFFPALYTHADDDVEPFHRKYDHVRYCPTYSDILPRGYCLKYLQNNPVALSPNTLRKADKDFEFFSNLLSFYKDLTLQQFFDKLKFFATIYLDECPLNETVIQSYVSTMPLLSTNEIIKCTNASTWFLCHIFIPTCEFNKTSKTFRYKPLCRESCVSHLFSDTCKNIYHFIVSLFKLGERCLKKFGRLDQFNCSSYPSYHDNVTKCQLQFQSDIYRNERPISENPSKSDGQSKTDNLSATIITVLSGAGGCLILVLTIMVIVILRRKRIWNNDSTKDEVTNTLSPYNSMPIKHEDVTRKLRNSYPLSTYEESITCLQ